MPVMVSFGDDFVLREDAAGWSYRRVGVEGPWVAELCDEDGVPIDVDAPVQNITSIQYVSQDEYEELADMM